VTTSSTDQEYRRRTCQFGPIAVDYDVRVLAPRPWTVLQSRWAAELAAGLGPGPILELCAGAGHIGLAAAVLADRDLVQVENDPTCAGYALFNAARANWAERTQVRIAPLQTALRPGEEYGLIVADPPYLPTDEVPRWPADPVAAIDGGADGLELVVACLVLAAEHLAAGGWLLLQVAGPAQAERVCGLLAGSRFAGLRSVDRRVVDERRAIMRVSRRW
jgi:release factor glutamine methyltransferase